VTFREIEASIPPMTELVDDSAPATPDKPSDRPVRWTVGALAAGDDRVASQAADEAQQLARALAANAVASAPDADVGEYADRLRTLTRSIWPDDPLEGFELHSSVGAYLIAKVAMGWAPPTDTTIRDAALDRDGVEAALVEQGVSATQAVSLLGDWSGPEEGFTPERDGLSAALLAGLAAGALSSGERAHSLNQLAYSPRCLARAAMTASSVEAVRKVIPVLPREDDELGSEYVAAMAALALGRPDRALALVGLSPEGTAQVTLAELARAQWNLERGEPAQLGGDPAVPQCELESNRPAPAPQMVAEDDDEEDVVEIVEEVVSGSTPPSDPAMMVPRTALPQPPKWENVELDETFVRLWREGRDRRRATFGHLQCILGLEAPLAHGSLPVTPIPPDAGTLRRILDERSEPAEANTAETERIDVTAFIQEQQEKLGLGSCEPVFPAVRAALRAVVAAAEGDAPTEGAVAAAGDLDWVVRRARAVALGSRGDLTGALDAVSTLGASAAPEALWVRGRALRYAGRPALEAAPSDRRRAAARIVEALAVQLGRTVAGTVI